jgi:phosphoenolpyruvate phosphomutase
MYFSGVTDALAKGRPGTAHADLTSQLLTIHDILEATTKPLIVHGGTGGSAEHFGFTVRTLERLGVAAIAIDRVASPSGNASLLRGHTQIQEEPNDFAQKISLGKQAQVGNDFSIIAAIDLEPRESGSDAALLQAQRCLAAGADAILIRGGTGNIDGIWELGRRLARLEHRAPLLLAPPASGHWDESQLAEAGIRAVIYADHLLRAAFTNMLLVAEALLRQPGTAEANGSCLPVSEILRILPGIQE